MSDYIIYTDSACDISPEIMKEWGVKCCSLTFHFEGEDREYSNDEMDAAQFYARMREGQIAKTSAVNVETFKAAFEPELQNGNDILYVGFSSGLSNTCNAGQIAANELMEQYPERKIVAVDTLAASAGFGMLLYLAVQQKNEGATLDETAQYLLDHRLNQCHWFTVDDLVYLKRGGRISSAVALIGTMLGIKPVMHVDNEGHLINVTQARSRKAALKALANKYTELAINPKAGPVFISHGDCMDDVERLKEMIHAAHGVEVQLVADVGPVIGAHSGPGTMALFFQGRER